MKGKQGRESSLRAEVKVRFVETPLGNSERSGSLGRVHSMTSLRIRSRIRRRQIGMHRLQFRNPNFKHFGESPIRKCSIGPQEINKKLGIHPITLLPASKRNTTTRTIVIIETGRLL
uniref:Uncharacterized protein n=1 Tax=Timema monikensis TaxID=170555 RepID=A0A7R9E3P9_9NEOP|nr:unnamed protein product [Timema monikensis]